LFGAESGSGTTECKQPPRCPGGCDPIIERQTDVRGASDPNDILGPPGFGEEHWVTADESLPYTIRFENRATATAPAAVVTVTQQLDPDLDWRTFRVGDFGWGRLVIDVPDRTTFLDQRLDLRDTLGFYVGVSVNISLQTGIATWTLKTIDPQTGEVTTDPLAGFLPPNIETGVGEGFVTYTIRPRRDAASGARVDAQARIIFDKEEPLDTPPIFNTLDAGVPESEVEMLPPVVTEPTFLVRWSGDDDANGSALAGFFIFVSDNGGAFAPWLENTTLTEAPFVGELGHTYAFYSIAADNAGNVESAPPTADAIIRIDAPPAVAVTLIQQGLTQRSYVDWLHIDFTEQVNLAELIADGMITSAVTLTNLGVNAPADADQVIPLAATQFAYQYDEAAGISRLTWSLDSYSGAKTSLADGFYQLVLDPSLITDSAGNSLDGNGDGAAGDHFVLSFHRLQGDVDGNMIVDAADMDIVNAALGATPGSTTWNPNADLDRDLRITVRDRTIVARATGNYISPPTLSASGSFAALAAANSADAVVVVGPPIDPSVQVPQAVAYARVAKRVDVTSLTASAARDSLSAQARDKFYTALAGSNENGHRQDAGLAPARRSGLARLADLPIHGGGSRKFEAALALNRVFDDDRRDGIRSDITSRRERALFEESVDEAIGEADTVGLAAAVKCGPWLSCEQ
jgi:hypothetical protein